jgi:pyruvate/2-oxoglutarate dehydrogenase complex dihydrolipoamide acyltransferase (E2) component
VTPDRSEPQNGPSSASANEQTSFEHEYDGYLVNRNEQPGSDEPDVVLDVPMLKVDELDLEVEDLTAHISLRAELANLVKVNVGVDVYLGKVKLGIKGVEAQALLKVRLERILGTLDRALEAISRDPQILREADRGAEQTVGGESQAAQEKTELTGDTAGQAGGATERANDASGRDDEVADEVEATDAARRKAQELGVRLSGVKGTGSGGRVLVKDVKEATG